MAESIVAFIIGIVVVYAVFKILTLPVKCLWKFVTNSVIGWIALHIAGFIGLPMTINLLTSFIAGVFGIPGLIAIIVYSWL